VTDGSALLPWIDHVDPGFSEVFGVAGGQRRAAGSADGGYLGVEAVYREAEAITVGHDRGVPDRGIGIEGLDELAERGEHFRGCSQQAVLPASAGQSLEAVADLGALAGGPAHAMTLSLLTVIATGVLSCLAIPLLPHHAQPAGPH
jgi:hypothetical protein